VPKAREAGLAGATAWRGGMGYGQSSTLHTMKLLRLSEDLPVVVEIVDAEEKVRAFLPMLETLVVSGLVTMEKVEVIKYGKGSSEPAT